MRILAVCTSTQVFGAEIATLRLLEALSRRGNTVYAITSTWTNGDFASRLEKLGIPYTAIPIGAFAKPKSFRAIKWTLDGLLHAPVMWKRWRKVLRQFRPDVVLLTSFRYAVWLFPWLECYRTFLVEHSAIKPTRSIRVAYALIANRLHGFVAVSEFIAQHLAAIGVSEKQISVISNGVFTSEEQKILETRQPKVTNGVRIGIVGQISEQKGHLCLLEAIASLRAKGLRFELWVFGNGEHSFIQKFNALATNRGVERDCHFLGYKNDRSEVFSQIDICVVPSVCCEAFGLVAAEAGGYCLPVVASNRGGLPEIVVDSKTGFLVDPENAQELAGGLERLIRDSKLRETFGRNGRRRVFNNFSNDGMIRRYEELFRR